MQLRKPGLAQVTTAHLPSTHNQKTQEPTTNKRQGQVEQAEEWGTVPNQAPPHINRA